MKNKSHKKLLAGIILGLGTIFLASCTANFCSTMDQASMAYPYDQGVTVYLSKSEFEALKAGDAKEVIEQELKWSAEAETYGLPAIAGPAFGTDNDEVYKYIPFKYKTTTTTNDDGTTTTTINYTSTGDLVFDSFTAKKYTSSTLATTITSATSNGYYLPNLYYYGLIDDYVLKAAVIESDDTGDYGWGKYTATSDWNTYIATDSGKAFVANLTACDASNGQWAVNPYDKADTDGSDAQQIDASQSILRENGRIKFSGKLYKSDKGDDTRDLWGYLNMWNAELLEVYVPKGFSQLDSYALPSSDFSALYYSNMTSQVNSIRSCIATRSGYYGHYGPNADWRVEMQQKDWAYSWHKGFLEGLLVYPVSWLTDTFALGMDPALTGMGQIWAIVFVTLIVRTILLVASFRSTLDSQKMQALQPELAKIQAKYPNANTNQSEKQRLSQEQMALYRRHGVKPFRQIFVLIIQFPVFICVWSGLQGSAALATGEFLNMSLSDTIQSILFNVSGTWYLNTHGWWTALVLFILMAAVQVLAMLLPKIIQKIQTRNMPKMNVNNAADQQNKTMKWVSVAMMAFTIVMGFMLPAAMGVYWLIGGLMSMIQTGITQIVLAKSKSKRRK